MAVSPVDKDLEEAAAAKKEDHDVSSAVFDAMQEFRRVMRLYDYSQADQRDWIEWLSNPFTLRDDFVSRFSDR